MDMDDDISGGTGRRIAVLSLFPLLFFIGLAALAQIELSDHPRQAVFLAVAVLGALVTAATGALSVKTVKSVLTDARQRSEILARRELAPTRWQQASALNPRVGSHNTDPFGELDNNPSLDVGANHHQYPLDNASQLDQLPTPPRTTAKDRLEAEVSMSNTSLQPQPDVSPPGHATHAVAQPSPAGNEVEPIDQVPDAVSAVAQDRAGPVVRNLVKRIQAMLDRQIDLVDELESKEEDPFYLEKLFKIDHLANRMRRTADGLLVLAGAGLDRRLGGPVPVLDVLRVSIGEVEDHRRVAAVRAETASVSAGAALALAHMAAELIENAIEFSPPEAGVDVVGRRCSGDGPMAYEILISDQGIGMTDAQLVELNSLLLEPQDLNTLSGHAMGLSVVGHLARRLEASVTLSSGGAGGVIASIQLPLAVLDGTVVEVETEDGDRPTPPLPETDRLQALPQLAPITPNGRSNRPEPSDQPSRPPAVSGLPVLDRARVASDVTQQTDGGQRRRNVDGQPQSPSRPSHRDPGEIEDMLRRYRQGQSGVEPTSSEWTGGGG